MTSFDPSIDLIAPNALLLAAIITVGVVITSILILKPFNDPIRQLSSTHIRIGVTKSKSKLNDQYSAAHQPAPDKNPKLQSLFIYPVKSCRGIELARSRVLPTGLEFDRLYTFAQLREPQGEDDQPTWSFLTQRQLPLLANVKVDLWLPEETPDDPTQRSNGFLVVRFPWKDAGMTGMAQWLLAKLRRGPNGQPEKHFRLPIDFPSVADIADRGYKHADVKIWNEITTALNMVAEVPVELKQYLGLKNRMGLFRMDPSRQREVFRCAPRKELAGYQPIVDFHDAYPLHMLSLTSLQDLDSKVEKDEVIRSLDARRFRANIITTSSEAYDEETWRSISFGTGAQNPSLFDVSCRTVRCKMPNVDPSNGIRHRVEPDRSLRKYRDVDEGAPKNGCLGMQLCPMFHDAGDPSNRVSTIEVGMDISVLQRGHHVYIEQ